ncbi:MAG: YraN family protein [Anaerolineae bacterium]|nr:YraN family protein [Anaerolineae bacterium]
MTRNKIKLGQRGETLASQILKQHGYQIIAQNWHCQEGEVDLIAQKDKKWIFFEVRTRRGKSHGTPEESLTPHKRARMEVVARHYLGEYAPDMDMDWDLGFIAVSMSTTGSLQRITVYPGLDAIPWNAQLPHERK